MVGLAGPVQAAPPTAAVDLTCTAAVSYGDEVDCRAASIDANGDYGTPGTFTFDPAHVLPATWSASNCTVSKSACEVSAVLKTPAGASPRTFAFVVNFVGQDGSRSTTRVSVDVSLRPTVTTVTCNQTEQVPGGTAHCVVAVVDEHSSRPAQLPSRVAGMTASSSDRGDAIGYDRPSGDRSTCVAQVVAADNALECGFSVRVGQTRGLRTVSARYGGDPAVDELPSTGTIVIANGARSHPVVALACPPSVPAAAPQTSCTVTVSGARNGPVPTGRVELDQAYGQPFPFDSGNDCTLVKGTCTLAYEVFEGTPSQPPPPVRALYSGDGNYLPGSASQVVTIIPTAAVATLRCDQTTPAVSTAMHCQLSVSTIAHKPVPVGPLDAITFVTTSGTVTCDQPAGYGCGHVNTATATLSGFTLHVGPNGGPQSVIGSYTGDQFALIAPASATFAFTPRGPLANNGPPVGVKTVTTTTVSCGPPVAYRHAARCFVTVRAHASVPPTGTVRLAPSAGGHAFSAKTCRLNVKGWCSVAVLPHAAPGSRISVVATYSGSGTFLRSVGVSKLAVRSVATSVTVRCARTTVLRGATVHCLGGVRTEFGQAAAVPASHRSQVTVTAHGDRVRFAGGRSCVWKRVGHTLTCAFSVTAGRVTGTRTIHVYYAGAAAVRESASKGSTKLKVTTAR
ncbi:MAG: large repetitive protein [Frankiales bacterium]|nr:large repetitive protein [Frankiales bacterium]